MNLKVIKSTIFLFFILLSFNCHAQSTGSDKQIIVAMRKIGHKVLLNSGDSLTRVLPIQQDSNSYKIPFESEFEFTPEDLIEIIDSIVTETGIAKRYIVEVEKCDTKEIVYSYEMENENTANLIACQTRTQPKSCYSLYISILDNDTQQSNSNLVYIILGLLILAISIYFGIKQSRKKIEAHTDNTNVINLGMYSFNVNNMELVFNTVKTELTSKEADLLILLYNSVNKVVERDKILNNVWGDEGDYVGRTLDVFISKLRKKLALDPSLKIINIRGIGYKLVVN